MTVLPIRDHETEAYSAEVLSPPDLLQPTSFYCWGFARSTLDAQQQRFGSPQ